MHFPNDRDIGYFEQLTSERSVVKVSGGQKYRVWELPSGRANEALDCRVYAYAALCGLTHLGMKLNRRADLVAQPLDYDASQQAWAPRPAPEQPAAPTPTPTPSTTDAKPVRKKLTSRLA
jgi:phage terminase large subunit GpA-like protein